MDYSRILKFNILIYMMFVTQSLAQYTVPLLQRDDYGTIKSWWTLHNEGFGGNPQSYPETLNGYMIFQLEDPLIIGDGDSWLEDGANVSIETASVNLLYPPQDTIFLRQRLRMVSSHLPGSRGWGFWRNEYPDIVQSEVMWFQQQREEEGWPWTEQETWWRVAQANGRLFSTNYYADLSSEYLTGWHVYDIKRYGMNRVEYYIDSVLIMSTDQYIPETAYEYNMWIDNVVYHVIPTGGDNFTIQIIMHEWMGQNTLVADYVEILNYPGPNNYSEAADGIIKLRQYPNEIAYGNQNQLWKNFSFSTESGRTVIIATAKVEELDGYDEPDQMKMVVDDAVDFGYTGLKGWDGDELQSATKTVLIDTSLTSGEHNIKVYSNVTPILYDVTILNAAAGMVVLDTTIEESAPAGSSNFLWKSFEFECANGDEVGIYINASADENPGWAHRGPGVSSQNIFDAQDDDLRIELDGTDYGWQTEDSWYGNQLFGEVKTVLLHETLSGGTHQLKFYSNNTPTLNRIIIFAENNDNSLPVTLKDFGLEKTSDGILLKWITESEIHNQGFNVYRAVTMDSTQPERTSFFKINDQLIDGAGNSSSRNTYSFLDYDINFNNYFWYFIEDLSYSGKINQSSIIYVKPERQLPVKLTLFQNYPNPFNHRTQIKFSLDKTGFLHLQVVDVSGKILRNLMSGQFEAGSHSVFWDGKSNNGLQVASGVYFYRIISDDNSIIKKLILLQ